jgi:hypothetical protein
MDYKFIHAQHVFNNNNNSVKLFIICVESTASRPLIIIIQLNYLLFMCRVNSYKTINNNNDNNNPLPS